MSYSERLTTEIHQALDDLAAKGATWDASWIAHAICGRHNDGLAPDTGHSDFWRHCGYEACREQVRRCINRRAGDRPQHDDGQMRLPGYDHLQAYYVVRRVDRDIGIPVHSLTEAELDQKARLYEAMGAACYAHADELRRYSNNRSRAA